MQNYSKKSRLYNTKIVVKTIIWKMDNSIYVINPPPKKPSHTSCMARLLYRGDSNGTVVNDGDLSAGIRRRIVDKIHTLHQIGSYLRSATVSADDITGVLP